MRRPATALTIYGARGSQPVSGDAYRRYGGRTSCFSVELDGGILIIDAGTGLAVLGHELVRRAAIPPIRILLTHVHLDHVIGLPLFQPFFRRDARITLMGSRAHVGPWQAALSRIFGKPFWPVELADVEATVRFENLSGSRARRLYGADVSWCPVQHPQGCLSYRIETSDGTLVVATDREHGHQRLDAAFVRFCHGADLLLHDAQYTPQELSRHRGWGHSTWEQAARAANAAGVRKLVLTSHDPGRSDAQIDRLVAHARRIFPNTHAASERLVIRLR